MSEFDPPLRKRKSSDFFAADEISNDLAEFTFDYLFSGKRRGRIIDLFVMTWIIDIDDQLFIRRCDYNRYPAEWKETIRNHWHNLICYIQHPRLPILIA